MPIIYEDLDEENLIDLINNMLKPAITEKPIVLVLGNTGCGKSTTINYLLGHRMIEDKVAGRIVITTQEKATAKIGHTMSSETLYAEIFTNDKSSYAYCDCPGFGDNRGSEAEICTNLSIEMAVNGSKCKAILAVCNYNSLTMDRGKCFNELVTTLYKIFKNPADIEKSIQLVITNVPERMSAEECLTEVKNLIQSIITHQNNLLTKAMRLFEKRKATNQNVNDNDLIEKVGIIGFLQLLYNNPRQIVPVIPLDNWETRENLLNAITDSPEIGIDSFDFKRYSKTRNDVDKALIDEIHEWNKKLTKLFNLPEKIKDIKDLIQNEEQNVSELVEETQEKEKELKEKEDLKTTKSKELENINAKLTELSQNSISQEQNFDQQICSLESNIKHCEGNISRIEKENEKFNKTIEKIKHQINKAESQKKYFEKELELKENTKDYLLRKEQMSRYFFYNWFDLKDTIDSKKSLEIIKEELLSCNDAIRLKKQNILNLYRQIKNDKDELAATETSLSKNSKDLGLYKKELFEYKTNLSETLKEKGSCSKLFKNYKEITHNKKDNLKEEIQDLEKHCQRIKGKVLSNDSEIQEKTKELNQYKDKLNSLERKNELLLKDVNDNKEKMDKIRQLITHLKIGNDKFENSDTIKQFLFNKEKYDSSLLSKDSSNLFYQYKYEAKELIDIDNLTSKAQQLYLDEKHRLCNKFVV